MGLSHRLLQSCLSVCTNHFLLGLFYLDKGFPSKKGWKDGFTAKSIVHNSKCSKLEFIAMGKQLASPKRKT